MEQCLPEVDFRGPEPEPELPPGNRATSGRTEFCQNSGKFLPEFRRNSGCSGTDRNFWRTSGDSGQDTWHGISRYWTQRPATLGARTQDGFSQAFRCPAAVCWPSPCAVLALYYGYRVVQAQNLAEFWQSSARTSTCTLYSSGRILPETDDPKPTGFLMHWQNSAEFGPNFHL